MSSLRTTTCDALIVPGDNERLKPSRFIPSERNQTLSTIITYI